MTSAAFPRPCRRAFRAAGWRPARRQTRRRRSPPGRHSVLLF
jgi:hypothetical protein